MSTSVSVTAVLRLVVWGGLTVWLLEALGRGIWHYLRTGVVQRRQARRMMARSLVGLAAYAVCLAALAGGRALFPHGG